MEDKHTTENLLGDKYEEKLQLLLAETEKLELFLKEQGDEVEKWKDMYQAEARERKAVENKYKEKESEVNCKRDWVIKLKNNNIGNIKSAKLKDKIIKS